MKRMPASLVIHDKSRKYINEWGRLALMIGNLLLSLFGYGSELSNGGMNSHCFHTLS
ncbi:MAG: hypothetical protein WAO19_07665 [Candidatus Kryptoniota bacterium]